MRGGSYCWCVVELLDAKTGFYVARTLRLVDEHLKAEINIPICLRRSNFARSAMARAEFGSTVTCGMTIAGSTMIESILSPISCQERTRTLIQRLAEKLRRI